MKNKIGIIIWCLLSGILSIPGLAQIEQSPYRRSLSGVNSTWHQLELPEDLFEKIQPDFSDLRIYGITTDDTLEVPYLLQELADKTERKEISFDLINQVKQGEDYYYTFKLPEDKAVNHLKLNLKNENFDGWVSLEGSQNQQEWFSIVQNQRILSIKNAHTNFRYTTLNFPKVKYAYLRLKITRVVQPELLSAQIQSITQTPGRLKKYTPTQVQTQENKSPKETLITLQLQKLLPVSQVQVHVAADFDFYRPIRIETLTDSVQSEKGWHYHYQTVYTGYLNSVEENLFAFENTLTRKVRIHIQHFDNEPLALQGFGIQGFQYTLVGRFAKEADYYLYYGSSKTPRPHYDIVNFRDKIPEDLQMLSVGEEEKIAIVEKPKTRALFENKLWLWAILLVMILIIGGLTIQMMRK
ncbi:DUF3999 family protein [Rapidithrix thailandica]|uniref:DUF3999 family protein n=1 Tax=Rapidithrix thailandica TaxID=413964 RepID=A0AAW9S243_9BACT